MSIESAAPLSQATATDELAERLVGAAIGAFELLSIYAGDRLGWYRALADAGPLTSAELAERTSTAERYCHANGSSSRPREAS